MLEFITSLKFCAPFYQIVLLLGLSTLALIFGKPKISLLINYLFALYWAYVFDREYILEAGAKHAAYFPWLYFGFGFAIFVLALLGLLLKND